MKKKIILICLFMPLLGSYIFCEALDISDKIFKTKNNIHGPVKSIITTLIYENASNILNLEAEYLPDGRIQSSQFLELSPLNVNTITVYYLYNISELIAIEYYANDNRLISSDIITLDDKIFIFQNIYKSIFVDCVVDFDGRFLFYLIPSWVEGMYLYQIELNDFLWEANIFDGNENLLYNVKYYEYIESEYFLIEDYFLGTNNKLELIYLNGNIIQLSLYDMSTEYLIMQKKYEYTRYDQYGNWLECIEENLGIKTIISRNILYYEPAVYEYDKGRYD